MARFTGYRSPPSTPPTVAAPYNSGLAVTGTSDRLTGIVYCNVAGTIYVEQSIDNGANWDQSTSYPVPANDGTGFSEEILAPYYRVRFVPSVNSTEFRIATRLANAGRL